MNMRCGRWTDQRIEGIIGGLLRAGVVLSGTVILIGGLVYLSHQGGQAPHYGVFVGGIATDALSRHGRGIIQLGLLFLFATPVAWVVFSVFAFAAQRDSLYVVVTLIVLAILVVSFIRASL